MPHWNRSMGNKIITSKNLEALALECSSSQNQLIFNFNNGISTTINVTNPTGNRIYTINDAGVNTNFVMSSGANQTLTNITLGSGTTISSNIAVSSGNPNIGTSSNYLGYLYADSPVIQDIYPLIGNSVDCFCSLFPNIDNSYNLGQATLGWETVYTHNLYNGSSLSVPASGTTIITDSATQTLTGKTLSSPTFSGTGASGTLNFNSGALQISSTGILLPTSGGSASTLNFYQSGDSTIIFGGPISNTTVNIQYARIGNICCIVVGNFTGTANGSGGSITSTTSIPSQYVPSGMAPQTIVAAYSGASNTAAILTVGTTGIINIYLFGAGGFSTTGTNGMTSNATITYTIS